MFVDNLRFIEKKLLNAPTRIEIMARCINKKLNVSLERYSDEVTRECEYLLSRSNYKVLKYISKG